MKTIQEEQRLKEIEAEFSNVLKKKQSWNELKQIIAGHSATALWLERIYIELKDINRKLDKE